MKVKKTAITLLPLMILVLSCKTVDNHAEKADYEKDLAPRETPYSNCFAIFPFTLNYAQSKPIMRINNSFILIDTGAVDTFVGEKGLADLFQDNYEMVMRNYDSRPQGANVHILNLIVGYWNIPSYNGAIKQIPFHFSDYPFTQFDGIIGENTFMQFSNVIIDYKNKLIVFDGEPIDSENIPMIIDEEGLCFIEFLCDGRKEIGLIDTGADNFVLRSTYFEKGCGFNHITKEQIEELKKLEVKNTPAQDILFNSVKIGKTEYKKQSGLLASDSRIKMTDEARGRLTEYSLLGFPIFKDKIIQLDYKNRVFRISN